MELLKYLKVHCLNTTEKNLAKTQEVIKTLAFENIGDTWNHRKNCGESWNHVGLTVIMVKGLF